MIPVFEPTISSADRKAVASALKKGEISGSFGQEIPSFETEFANFIGVKYAVAVTSGTTALHLAVAAAGLGPGDEVLISSSTNIATALAVVHNGATPVPVDSEPETWNLNLEVLETLITPKTKAIVPVHLYGHPIEMQRLMKIARKHRLIVIEDCAESHGATSHGQITGSFGDLNCFSFYANKIITTGEGGMIVTDNKAFAEKLQLLRNLAFTIPRFKHKELGYNFRMTGLQAALGRSQLSRINQIVEKKRWIARQYHRCLADLPYLQLPQEKTWAYHVYWMYAFTLTEKANITRDQLMDYLKSKGIDTRTFFCPMNQQPALLELKHYKAIPCPVADRLWETGLYLPSSLSLTKAQIKYISQTIRDVLSQ